ncbi:MAG: Gfo/Idh/MocA family oxidoreductase [Clostridia bacterium]|nr:Gfo/Idh/MocA family oxidoreductase [Clostridia bacterium]
MKRFVLVGTGHRGTQAYLTQIPKELSDCVEIVAVCDRNSARAKAAIQYAELSVPVYTDFDKMLAEINPDGVIVTTIDATHDEFIIKALEAGCEVVSEKPLTTDGDKANAIKAAEDKAGGHVTVTFNCRFMPFFVRIKELLKEKVIGDIYDVHYEWMLDTSHGASYFRRWHRERKNSGSLLIHKSTHHFDLLNWWLEDEPEAVNAFGARRFYIPSHQPHGERCLTCPYKSTCKFYFDITRDDFYNKMYYSVENEDGYIRDQCPFSEEIDIEDNVAMNIRYKGGTVVTYNLVAYAPYEGMKIVFNGSEGRMEVINIASQCFGENPVKEIRIYNRCNEEIVYHMPANSMLTKFMVGADQVTKDNLGGHGGSDPLIRAAIFRGMQQDPLGQMADLRAGIMSLGIGAAANVSMKEHRAVELKEILDI